MKNSIAIIMTDFLKDFIDDILDEFFCDDNFLLYYYQNFQEILDIFVQIPEHIEGVVISGSYPAQVIRMFFPDSPRVIVEFNNDDLGIFRLFFKLLHSSRNLQLNRVYADVLDVGNISLEDYLLMPFTTPINEIHRQAASKLTLEELIEIEQVMLERHITKWKNSEIDVSITRFSSIVTQLEEAGLDVHFAYPDKHYVKEVIQSVQQGINIRSMEQKLPACLCVSVKHEASEYHVQQLSQALDTFFSLLGVDAIMKQKSNGFEIITQKKFVAKVTLDYSSCSIQTYVRSHLPFDVDIGYGLGSSLYQSKMHAINALRESKKYKRGTSCLINENNQLISPLNADHKFKVYSELSVLKGETHWVSYLSKETGISPLNIQKIIAAKQSIPDNKITSQEIAYKLRITRRSANRLLNLLKSAGRAKVVGQRQGTSLGRPENVYELDLTTPSKEKGDDNSAELV